MKFISRKTVTTIALKYEIQTPHMLSVHFSGIYRRWENRQPKIFWFPGDRTREAHFLPMESLVIASSCTHSLKTQHRGNIFFARSTFAILEIMRLCFHSLNRLPRAECSWYFFLHETQGQGIKKYTRNH